MAAAIVRPSFNKFRMSGQSRLRFCLLPSFPPSLYRHSRVSGNPEMPGWQQPCLTQYRPGFPLTRE